MFAFESDLTDKTEFERFAEINPDLYADPQLVAICVVGKGYWYHNDRTWIFHKLSGEYDEALVFLSGMTIEETAGASFSEHP